MSEIDIFFPLWTNVFEDFLGVNTHKIHEALAELKDGAMKRFFEEVKHRAEERYHWVIKLVPLVSPCLVVSRHWRGGRGGHGTTSCRRSIPIRSLCPFSYQSSSCNLSAWSRRSASSQRSKPIPTSLHRYKKRSDALNQYTTALEDPINSWNDTSMPNALAIRARVFLKSVHRQAFSVLLSCLRAAAPRVRDLAMDATLDFRRRGTWFGRFGTNVLESALHSGQCTQTKIGSSS